MGRTGEFDNFVKLRTYERRPKTSNAEGVKRYCVFCCPTCKGEIEVAESAVQNKKAIACRKHIEFHCKLSSVNNESQQATDALPDSVLEELRSMKSVIEENSKSTKMIEQTIWHLAEQYGLARPVSLHNFQQRMDAHLELVEKEHNEQLQLTYRERDELKENYQALANQCAEMKESHRVEYDKKEVVLQRELVETQNKVLESQNELLVLKDNHLQQLNEERERHAQEVAALREELNDEKKRHTEELHNAKTQDSSDLEAATKRYAVCTNKKDTRIDKLRTDYQKEIDKLRMDCQKELGKLQREVAKLKGENLKLAEKVNDLEENNEALRTRQLTSDRYGKESLIAYDNISSGKRPRDIQTELRIREKAGKHFGLEPSDQMMAQYRQNFPQTTGVMSSPSRSRSPSPCR